MSGSVFDSRFFRGGSSNTQTSSSSQFSSSFQSTTTTSSGGATQVTQTTTQQLTRQDLTPISQVSSSSNVPLAPTNVRLSLIENDLILQWDSQDPTRPDQTKIDFTQPNGASKEFVLNLYQTTFDVPFREFSSFRPGSTTARVSQAFNPTSGSPVFGPSTALSFNAGQHHYAIWREESGLRQISYRLAVDASVVLSGVAREGVNNEVILVTPDRQILSFYFDDSRQRPDVILRAGEQLFLSVPVAQYG